MTNLQITEGGIEKLMFEGTLTTSEGVDLTVTEEGDWIEEGKLQIMEIIFTDGAKFYRGHVGRSGDHWSGYEYDSTLFGEDSPARVEEVRKVEVTIEQWKAV